MYSSVIESSSVKPNKSKSSLWFNLNLQHFTWWQTISWAPFLQNDQITGSHHKSESLSFQHSLCWLPILYIIRTNHNSRIWNELLSKQLNIFLLLFSLDLSIKFPKTPTWRTGKFWWSLTGQSRNTQVTPLEIINAVLNQISAASVVNTNLYTNTWCLYINILYILQICIYTHTIYIYTHIYAYIVYVYSHIPHIYTLYLFIYIYTYICAFCIYFFTVFHTYIIFHTYIHIYYTKMGTLPPLEHFMHYIYIEEILNIIQ